MKLPWSIQHVLTYKDTLTLPSILALRSAHIAERGGNLNFRDRVRLTLKAPRVDIQMRPASNDIYTLGEIFLQQIYSEVAQRLSDLKTIVDLGSNIGFATIYLNGKFPESRFCCVEPDMDNFDLLTRNLDYLVRQDRCNCICAGVWSKTERLQIDGTTSEGHVNQRRLSQGDDCGSIGSIQGMTITDILTTAKMESVDLLKVDIEGAEVQMFQGSVEWLSRVNAIAIEFHNDSRVASDFDAKVKAYGFNITEADGHTIFAAKVQT
jgi:FkbM family methyltransferase